MKYNAFNNYFGQKGYGIFMKKGVFVTGGNSGTGFAIAERFAKEGYSVVVTCRNLDDAKNVALKISEKHGVTAYGYDLELRNEERATEIFSDIDKKDLFIETICLNAADLGFGKDPAKGLPMFESSIQDFRNVFEANIIGNFVLIKQAALRMKEHGKGAIVFISSNTAYRAIPNRIAYSASKGGINAMSKALAVDLGPYGIRSNVVLPGTIKTERWVKMGNKRIVDGSLTPIGDISDFEDIANAAWYLGSDESKNVTGAEITVDGGMTCQLYPQLLTELKNKM